MKKRKGEWRGDQDDPSTELRVLHAGAKAPNPSRSSTAENTGQRELEIQQGLGRVKWCILFCSVLSLGTDTEASQMPGSSAIPESCLQPRVKVLTECLSLTDAEWKLEWAVLR